MKQPTLQEQYNLLKEGKGHKGNFLKEAHRVYPQYIRPTATFKEVETILKQKNLLLEQIIGGGIAQPKTPDWFKIFEENIIESKENVISKAPKEVEDLQSPGFDNKDLKNIDNVYGGQFLQGFYTEMQDPKNEEKTVDEIKEIVRKNLEKDRLHYVKDGVFGIKGLGYTDEHPGLKASKSDQMEKVKLNENKQLKENNRQPWHPKPEDLPENELEPGDTIYWTGEQKEFDYFGDKKILELGEEGKIIAGEIPEKGYYLVEFQGMRFYAWVKVHFSTTPPKLKEGNTLKENKSFPVSFYGQEEEVYFKETPSPKGTRVDLITTSGEPFATLSYFNPDYPPLEFTDEFWLKDWSENEEIVDQLLDSNIIGIAHDTGERNMGGKGGRIAYIEHPYREGGEEKALEEYYNSSYSNRERAERERMRGEEDFPYDYDGDENLSDKEWTRQQMRRGGFKFKYDKPKNKNMKNLKENDGQYWDVLINGQIEYEGLYYDDAMDLVNDLERAFYDDNEYARVDMVPSRITPTDSLSRSSEKWRYNLQRGKEAQEDNQDSLYENKQSMEKFNKNWKKFLKESKFKYKPYTSKYDGYWFKSNNFRYLGIDDDDIYYLRKKAESLKQEYGDQGSIVLGGGLYAIDPKTGDDVWLVTAYSQGNLGPERIYKEVRDWLKIHYPDLKVYEDYGGMDETKKTMRNLFENEQAKKESLKLGQTLFKWAQNENVGPIYFEDLNTGEKEQGKGKGNVKFIIRTEGPKTYVMIKGDQSDDNVKLLQSIKQKWETPGDNFKVQKDITTNLLWGIKGVGFFIYNTNYEVRETRINEAKKKNTNKDLEGKLAEIDKAGKLVVLEAQIEALYELIESKTQRINMVNEDETMAELIDRSKVKQMEKEVKLLEKRKAKMEKVYEKTCGKSYKRQITEEPEEEEDKKYGSRQKGEWQRGPENDEEPSHPDYEKDDDIQENLEEVRPRRKNDDEWDEYAHEEEDALSDEEWTKHQMRKGGFNVDKKPKGARNFTVRSRIPWRKSKHWK